MEEGQLKKRIADFIKVRSTDMYVDPETTAAHREVEAELSSVVDEAKKDIFEDIDGFEFHEPYTYNLPQLQIRYEEASRKLVLLLSKLLKWFGGEKK